MNKYKVESSLSTILSIVGVGGIVATAIVAARDHKKAEKKLGKKKLKDMKAKEFVTEIVPCYIPTVSLVTGTSLCVIGSHILGKKSQASLVGAFEISKFLYEDYRKGAKTVYGDDADEKIQDAVAAARIEESDDDKIVYAPGYTLADFGKKKEEKYLFYESIGDVYFEATLDQVKDAMYHLNRNFILRGGYAPFSEFYDFLNLKNFKPKVGTDVLSWVAGDDFGCQRPIEKSMDVGIDELWFTRGESGYEWIDYYISNPQKDAQGREFYPIRFPFAPELCDDIWY